ncbi:glycine--tRNA ligase subunit beta [Thermosulfurimonas marina]|uniref:Glycine--tRNA ligase beta subunit n=1 Tax=Thermosulfurimonas marina TaxID=2047767 RepID=A0A6H1WT21_9BACT|nr:glycine--tRNA ligase subunit beta [Thermosulfurimonas marina]QJA06320.1 glycine--tRNA ligase subunit beta [Thermosulfurimonas marina]
MARDLLFEIGCEELPARFLEPALKSLSEEARGLFSEAALEFAEIRTLGTPRRLTLYVKDLSEKQPDRREEILGPPKRVAFDEKGQPTAAALGFARKQGVGLSEVRVKKTPKGEYLAVEKLLAGRRTTEILPEILRTLLARIHFPKRMRWGNHDFTFARPIRWLLALFGDEVVPLEVAGVKSSRVTYGHRFLAPKALEVRDFNHYLSALREAFVLVDPGERLEATRREVLRAAEEAGGRPEEDPELLSENAHLVEFPFALSGTFPEEYLELPEPLLITAMREHQRYFAVRDGKGRLLPAFVAVNNNRPRNPEILRAGHERVLRARLEDARFYYQRDLEIPLSERVRELSGVVYHAALGTLLEKTERLKALCGYLAERLFPEVKAFAVQAAELAKADLVSEVVGEFPSLQGEMGRIYALSAGKPPEVAEALAEQYLPRGAEERVALSPCGIVLSLADKADHLAAFFGIGERPTGAADPYGLRRAAYGLLKTLLRNELSLSLRELFTFTLWLLKNQGFLKRPQDEVLSEILEFLARRLEGEFLAEGFPLDEVRAVIRVGADDPLEAHRRLAALHAVRQRPEFAALAVAFKRVMNMVRGLAERYSVDEGLFEKKEERVLYQVLQEVKAELAPLLSERRYQEALLLFTRLKDPIDRFFDEVFVMVKDEARRKNRLGLLQSIAEDFLKVADLSELDLSEYTR